MKKVLLPALSIAIVCLVSVLAISGCGKSKSEDKFAPFIGVFKSEWVEGRPAYSFEANYITDVRYLTINSDNTFSVKRVFGDGGGEIKASGTWIGNSSSCEIGIVCFVTSRESSNSYFTLTLLDDGSIVMSASIVGDNINYAGHIIVFKRV